MRKTILLFMIFLITVFNLISCSIEQKEITFWTMPNAPNDVHMEWMKNKREEFRKETGITVNFMEIGWRDAWIEISTSLATGIGFDVCQVGTTWNPQFAATGGLMELNINEFGGEKSFFSANLTSCKLKDAYYGIPWIAETRCLYYNTKIFKELGLRPPKTHDELIEVGKKIIKANGEGTAIAIAGTQAWDLLHNWSIILWGNGGALLDEKEHAVFNSQEGISAMKWYIDLMRLGLADNKCANYS